MHERSATEPQQPACKQALQFYIYTVKGNATVSISTDQQNSLFSKILFIR